jgi:hypothetical protein
VNIWIVEDFHSRLLKNCGDKGYLGRITKHAVGFYPLFNYPRFHIACLGQFGHGDARDVHGDIENGTRQLI